MGQKIVNRHLFHTHISSSSTFSLGNNRRSKLQQIHFLPPPQPQRVTRSRVLRRSDDQPVKLQQRDPGRSRTYIKTDSPSHRRTLVVTNFPFIGRFCILSIVDRLPHLVTATPVHSALLQARSTALQPTPTFIRSSISRLSRPPYQPRSIESAHQVFRCVLRISVPCQSAPRLRLAFQQRRRPHHLFSGFCALPPPPFVTSTAACGCKNHAKNTASHTTALSHTHSPPHRYPDAVGPLATPSSQCQIQSWASS